VFLYVYVLLSMNGVIAVIVLMRRSLDGFWKWLLKGGDKGVIVSREALLEIGFTFNKRG